ncbi:lysozyme [Cedecea sp.]|jgi:lysozyme|uniref:lysozyme n=1 Tax=Cedecea sp. TaxID=1970739 RepID=UPI0012AE2738|nr:glycoside hydrolase family protein [Enterobacteriaceae bacterium RIT693]
MALSPGLRKALFGLSGAGALTIAGSILPELEGMSYTPYHDVAGVLTVCYGHTGKDIIPDKTYSSSECRALLDNDLRPAAQVVSIAVTVPVSEYQRAALISFTYNVGTTAFLHSSVLRTLNGRNYEQACAGLKKWIWAGGKQWQGLINRREVEYQLCTWPEAEK